MEFYGMSGSDRSRWLDDGLHLTQYGYEQLGDFVYQELSKHLCSK